MKLTKEQKNQIYNKNMIVDDWEWVPCINHVLRVLNYDDNLIHDENYETVKWSGTEPLIKDEKIRKAVRAWAEACGAKQIKYYISSNQYYDADMGTGFSIKFLYKPDEVYLEEGKTYTIAELCGEEEK